MFTMMNAARLAVGVQGLATGERSWQQAVSYARTRKQGRVSGTPPGEQAAIAEHPDVRRMLADLRATTRAMRLVLYVTAALGMAAGAGDETARRRADLMTPIAKAWPTEMGVRLASEALQVHGGIGYIEDAGIAQRLRDSRIAPIYEGTNGIQAIDLVMRKVLPDRGAALEEHLRALEEGMAKAHDGAVDDLPAVVREGIGSVRAAARWLVGQMGTSDDVLAGATPFLELVGTVTATAMLAAVALSRADSDELGAAELLADARYFASCRMTAAMGLAASITAGVATLPHF
jgi:hypothetical protein